MGKDQKKIMAECGYCGHIVKVTTDHVIPKCLFLGDTPQDVPRVPACEKCNNKKSISDSDLRDLLVCEISTQNHSVAQEIFNTKFNRSVKQGRSKIAVDALNNNRLIQWFSPSGIFVDYVYQVKVPEHRITDAVTWIVRGLHYAFTEQRLTKNTPVIIQRWLANQDLQILVNVTQQAGGKRVQIGDGDIFACMYYVAVSNPRKIFYLLQFYQGIYFSVAIDHNVTGNDLAA